MTILRNLRQWYTSKPTLLITNTVEARKSMHCSWPGQISYDERKYHLGLFDCPGKIGNEVVDQLSTRVVKEEN